MKKDKISWIIIIIVGLLVLPSFLEKETATGIVVHYYDKDKNEIFPYQKQLFSIVTPEGGLPGQADYISLDIVASNPSERGYTDLQIIEFEDPLGVLITHIGTLLPSVPAGASNQLLFTTPLIETSQYESQSQPVNFRIKLQGVDSYTGETIYSEGSIDITFKPEPSVRFRTTSQVYSSSSTEIAYNTNCDGKDLIRYVRGGQSASDRTNCLGGLLGYLDTVLIMDVPCSNPTCHFGIKNGEYGVCVEKETIPDGIDFYKFILGGSSVSTSINVIDSPNEVTCSYECIPNWSLGAWVDQQCGGTCLEKTCLGTERCQIQIVTDSDGCQSSYEISQCVDSGNCVVGSYIKFRTSRVGDYNNAETAIAVDVDQSCDNSLLIQMGRSGGSCSTDHSGHCVDSTIPDFIVSGGYKFWYRSSTDACVCYSGATTPRRYSTDYYDPVGDDSISNSQYSINSSTEVDC